MVPPVVPPDLPANPAPPPVSGGSLLVTDTQLAVAADSDHDVIWVTDLRTDTLRGFIELAPGAHPGRLVEDADGRVHAVLRDAGAVVSLDVDNLEIMANRPVCAAPRGIAFDDRRDDLHVACASGELVTLPAAGGDVSASIPLASDLRDVVMDGDMRMISRFASAEVLVVDDAGTIVHRMSPAPYKARPAIILTLNDPEPDPDARYFLPSVAWRAIPHKSGGMALLHQRAFDGDVDPDDGYGGGDQCAPGLVHGAVSVARSDGRISSDVPFPSLLAVDIALDRTGNRGLMAMAGGLSFGTEEPVNFVLFFNKDGIFDEDDEDDDTDPDECNDLFFDSRQLEGQPISVAYDDWDRAIVQLQSPYGLAIFEPLADEPTYVDFPVVSPRNESRFLFHAFSEAFISCASCHPEGRQDNHVWTFSDFGPRRTPALLGGLLGTEPFHWSGDMANMGVLMEEVFEGRMSHTAIPANQVEDLAMWLDALPAIPHAPPADVAAVARGQALFQDAQVGCAGCHAGPLLTDNRTVDVGTGEPLQVPRLIGIWARDRIMHDGCADTLADRFGPCGGGDAHGQTSHLSEGDIADLLAYLRTL